jgi:hypothetical protein
MEDTERPLNQSVYPHFTLHQSEQNTSNQKRLLGISLSQLSLLLLLYPFFFILRYSFSEKKDDVSEPLYSCLSKRGIIESHTSNEDRAFALNKGEIASIPHQPYFESWIIWKKQQIASPQNLLNINMSASFDVFSNSMLALRNNVLGFNPFHIFLLEIFWGNVPSIREILILCYSFLGHSPHFYLFQSHLLMTWGV